jgi:hypothetical protein
MARHFAPKSARLFRWNSLVTPAIVGVRSPFGLGSRAAWQTHGKFRAFAGLILRLRKCGQTFLAVAPLVGWKSAKEKALP